MRWNQTRPSSLRYPWPCTTLFCTFLCWHCTTTKWNFLISRFVRDVNTRIYNSRKICENLTNWTGENKSNEVRNSENSHFKWRFRHRRRRWLFKLLNEGNRREWRTLYIVLDPTLVLANITYQLQAIVTSRTCRRGVHSPISGSNYRENQ